MQLNPLHTEPLTDHALLALCVQEMHCGSLLSSEKQKQNMLMQRKTNLVTVGLRSSLLVSEKKGQQVIFRP